MNLNPLNRSQAYAVFDEMQRQGGLSGAPSSPIAPELLSSPGFLIDRFEDYKDNAGASDNLARLPGGYHIRRAGVEMQGKILGSPERGVISDRTVGLDHSGGVSRETHTIVRYSKDQIQHFLVSVNDERLSALVQNVDRQHPEKSWTQSMEWNLSS